MNWQKAGEAGIPEQSLILTPGALKNFPFGSKSSCRVYPGNLSTKK